ncbi:chemotaxis protein CheW [Candidatus Poribacteria bacterium]|nr:MAG: chemotaxis protein CheW [Candidatus Poribacteria bacterium]
MSGGAQFVSFKLGEEKYGIDILSVKEIIRMQPVTRVPNTPEYVRGVINLRGEIIPIVDLRKKLGIPPTEDKSNRIIVVEHQDKKVGFIVDSVSEVLRVEEDSIEPPPSMMRIDSRYISGIAKLDGEFMIVLDLNRLLEEELETAQLEKISQMAEQVEQTTT